MKAARKFVAGWLTLLCWAGATVAGAGPQAVLEVLPTETMLGSGWKREICLLSDPLSKPSEIRHTTSPLSETAKKEKSAEQQDPKSVVNGEAHTHFTLQTTNGPRLFDVQIARYRDRERLKSDFDHLLNLKSERFEKTPVTGLGDAAVFYRDTQTGGTTLWFRRADFQIWLATIGSRTSWAEDSPLQHLAKTLDQRIAQGSLPAEESSRPVKERHKP